MSLDPKLRYPSADELKADVRRWMQRDLVEAHRHKYTIRDRAESFIARNQRSVIWSGLGIAVALFATLWGAAQISLSAEKTKSALQNERAANEQLFASLEKYADTIMSEEILATPTLKPIRDRILSDLTQQYELWVARSSGTEDEKARAIVGSLRLAEIEQLTGNMQQALVSSNRAFQLAKTLPLNTSQALTTVNRAYRSAAALNAALGQLHSADQIAQELTEQLHKHESLMTVTGLLEQQALNSQLLLELSFQHANVTRNLEERMKALLLPLSHADSALERRVALSKLDPSFQRTLDLAAALNARALMRHKLFRSQEAIEDYRAATEHLDGVDRGTKEQNLALQNLRVKIQFNSMMAYRAVDDIPNVRKVASEGLSLCQELSERYPLVIRYREELIRGHGNLAEVLMNQFRDKQDDTVLPEALVQFRQAATISEQIAQQYPDRQSAKMAAAVQYLRLVACLHWAQRDEEALAEFRRCLKATDRPELLEPGHRPNAYAASIGYALQIRHEKPVKFADHPAATRLAETLRVAKDMFPTDTGYRDRFLKDPLFDEMEAIESVKSLRDTIRESY